MQIEIPPDILENSEAALALFATIICLTGIAICIIAYVAFFTAMQNVSTAVSPQFDSIYTVISDTQGMLIQASNSTQSLSDAMQNLSLATSAYSTSTSGISNSLSAIAKVPPFSLNTQFTSSVATLQGASADFAGAAASMNSSASEAQNISDAFQTAIFDVGQAGQTVSGAKASFDSAVLTMDIAGLFACIAMIAFFLSVILVSVSILLSHYPRLFGAKAVKEEPEPEQEKTPQAEEERAPEAPAPMLVQQYEVRQSQPPAESGGEEPRPVEPALPETEVQGGESEPGEVPEPPEIPVPEMPKKEGRRRKVAPEKKPAKKKAASIPSRKKEVEAMEGPLEISRPKTPGKKKAISAIMAGKKPPKKSATRKITRAQSEEALQPPQITPARQKKSAKRIEPEEPEAIIRPTQQKKAAAMPTDLTAYEKIVYEKYGQVGVQVYRLVDGNKTGEEIVAETGIPEGELIEILEFMDRNGIIKLQNP